MHSVDGSGIGIGVLSDGVDTLAARQATGDLPAGVTVLAGQAGSGDEGTAMLEIVHDLAPGADLYFATAFGGEASFAQNIQDLCNAGADVIVDDIFYFAEGPFQDDVIAQGVNTAVGNGCAYFSSAGNSGNLNDGTSGVWEGDFQAAAMNPPGIPAAFPVHDFGGGANSNQITKDPPFNITLHWSDPLLASANDYDLCLFDSALTAIEICATSTQDGSQDPFEIIGSGSFNDNNKRLVIVQDTGAPDRFLHLNTIRGELAIATDGQTAGHGAAENTVGVAAACANPLCANPPGGAGGVFNGTEPVETFSSDGPRRIFFEADGTPITPGNFLSTGGRVVQQPEITAADGVSTATPGFDPFFGTSVAAPHAAAIAALTLEASGGPGSLTLGELRTALVSSAVTQALTYSQLRSNMASTALDIEAAGIDRDSGAGILDALAAVGAVASAPPPPFTDEPLVVGTTPVKALHITELRTRVNGVRATCGLGMFSFTDTIATGVTVRALHITQLRLALDQAYVACFVAAPTYTDATLTAGTTAIKAVHIEQLRAAVKALE